MIYFIDAKEVGRVKVGYAKRSVLQRLSNLQIASPVLLTMRWSGPGARQQERMIHRLLSEHRHVGEWFDDGPHIDAAISFASGLPVVADVGLCDIEKEQRAHAARAAAALLSHAPSESEVRCSYCKARPGQPCRLVGPMTMRKGFETQPHQARRKLFSEAMRHRPNISCQEVTR